MFLTKSLSREDRNLNLIAYFQVERSKIMHLWFQLCLQAFQPKQTGTVHKYCVEMILSEIDEDFVLNSYILLSS
jgi:hypothetical protein